MTVEDWLKQAQALLSEAGVMSARLDCLILLEDASQKDRGWLLAHPEYELSSDQVVRLEKLLSRRTKHEPLAYIRNQVEFYGRTFVVNKSVLVPRPESEAIITLLLQIYTDLVQQKSTLGHPANDPPTLKIADVGSGSGALGITAKLELPDTPKLVVELLEIDEEARKTAKINVDLFTLDIPILESDLMSNTAQDYDVLLCNLPYIPDEYPVNDAAKHEPKIALYSGNDGLNHYRHLFFQVHSLAKQPLYLLIEALPSQHAELQKIASSHLYKLLKTDGLIQLYQR